MSHIIESEVTSVVQQAQGFAVATHEQARDASAFLNAVKALQRKVRETFGPLKQAASDAHKKIVAEEKRNLDPLDRAEAEIKNKIGGFLDSERRKREEEERKAREEQARLERERRIAEEAARKAAEDERLRVAERLEAEGRKAEAERVVSAPLPPPVVAPRPYVPPLPPPKKVEGVATRETFSANVYSLAELAAHVAANPAQSYLIQPNLPELNRMARALKQGGAQVVPGVACVASREVVSR